MKRMRIGSGILFLLVELCFKNEQLSSYKTDDCPDSYQDNPVF